MKDATVQKSAERSKKQDRKRASDSSRNDPQNEKENSESAPQKLNAFQFMMNSRHRSIGRNSPGRELDPDDSQDDLKQELTARKSRLQTWAEKKGAAKRKRDEEIGNCINHKLEKRGRKLRKLLNIDCQSDDEVITKRKKKCAVIESDEEGETKKKKKDRMSLNAEQLTPKSVKAWKFKIKLSMRENDVENRDSQSEIETQSVECTQSENAHLEGSSQSEKESQSEMKVELSHSENAPGDSSTHSEIKTENTPEDPPVDAPSRLSPGESKTENPTSDLVAQIDETVDECVVLEQTSEESEDDMRRVLRTRRKPRIYADFVSDSDGEDSSKKRKKAKTDVKMAPVFLKALPKPKVDPKLAEARREFLLSGVPSSLKKEMERQQCLDDVEFDVFPTISHIQQRSPDNRMWGLPKTELKLSELETGEIEIKPFSRSLLSWEEDPRVATENRIPLNKIKNCKRLIRELKSQNPNYPVYKIFNSIYAKSGYQTEKVEEPLEKKTTGRKRGRPRKNPEKKTEPKVVKIDIKPDEAVHALWTDKYKPKSSSDIIGNHSSVSALKEWLTNWLSTKKSKKKKSDSESEFDITDSDSRDSTNMHGNTVILNGPSGSGKTAAVYAICNELGFDVLEVNASSKRTGKRLQQELQEATQSHQVCKKEIPLASFVKESKERPDKSSAKMCVLFIEDVDLVFDQDEGFSAALCQIITTSKRPIILTTTGCNVQRVLSNHKTISFGPLTSLLAVWLQIVCLVEGLYVHVKALDELLSYNRGDIRRTLLQLQLYVNSGGQLYKGDHQIGDETEVLVENVVKTDDDNSNLADLRPDEPCEGQESVQIHYNCLKDSGWQRCKDLEVIWWNFPSILNTPNLAKVRLERTSDVPRDGDDGQKKLRMISDCYESLAYADVICGKSQTGDTLGARWRTEIRDGLGLNETTGGYSDCEFSEELALTLLHGTVKRHQDKYDESPCLFKMAVPEPTERRWRCKNLACEEKLEQALLQSDFLARKSLALDYMPYLRTIARCDLERASNNTKRGNRYYSHLKSLGVRCGEQTYQMASQVFQIWN